MLAIPDHVHATTTPRGGGVLLDRRSGRCYVMNGTAHELWREWRRTGDFDAGLASMAARDKAYAGSGFRADSRELADKLLARGLLSVRTNRRDISDTPIPPADSVVPGFRFAAALAVPITLLLVRLPFRVTTRVLSWSRTHWCRRGATTGQALAAALATESAARYHPGRIACLELSLGAVVTMAVGRRHLSLVVGVADDPCRFHAWVAAADGPVHYPSSDDIHEFRPIAVI
jgi:hypothetical protein